MTFHSICFALMMVFIADFIVLLISPLITAVVIFFNEGYVWIVPRLFFYMLLEPIKTYKRLQNFDTEFWKGN